MSRHTRGITVRGERWWQFGPGGLTDREERDVKRLDRVEEESEAVMQSGGSWNASYRTAVREVTGVDFGPDHDFRLKYPKEQKNVREN